MPTAEVANMWREQATLLREPPPPLWDDHLLIDRRRLHTNQLLGAVMQIIYPHLHDGTERDVARRLFDLFYTAGAVIITDAQRADAGLPPRNNCGWTCEELRIYEYRHTEIMLEKMAPRRKMKP